MVRAAKRFLAESNVSERGCNSAGMNIAKRRMRGGWSVVERRKIPVTILD